MTFFKKPSIGLWSELSDDDEEQQQQEQVIITVHLFTRSSLDVITVYSTAELLTLVSNHRGKWKGYDHMNSLQYIPVVTKSKGKELPPWKVLPMKKQCNTTQPLPTASATSTRNAFAALSFE